MTDTLILKLKRQDAIERVIEVDADRSRIRECWGVYRDMCEAGMEFDEPTMLLPMGFPDNLDRVVARCLAILFRRQDIGKKRWRESLEDVFEHALESRDSTAASVATGLLSVALKEGLDDLGLAIGDFVVERYLEQDGGSWLVDEVLNNGVWDSIHIADRKLTFGVARPEASGASLREHIAECALNLVMKLDGIDNFSVLTFADAVRPLVSDGRLTEDDPWVKSALKRQVKLKHSKLVQINQRMKQYLEDVEQIELCTRTDKPRSWQLLEQSGKCLNDISRVVPS